MTHSSDEIKSRHLLWIHQNFVSARQAGNSRPIHLIAALLEQGWEVDIVTSQSGYLDDGPESSQKDLVIEQEGRLTLHRLNVTCSGSQLWNRGHSYLNFLTKAFRYVPRFKKIDVIYAHTPLPQILLSVILSTWRKIPLVFGMGDLWPAYLIECKLLKSFPLILAMEWLEALVYHYADYCIPVVPAFAPYLTEMGVSKERITVVPTGGDAIYSKADKNLGAQWRKKYGFEEKFLLVYTGSFNEPYGLETLLEAAHQIAELRPEITWIFAGNGRLRPIIENTANKLDCVHYLGSLSKDELLPLYLAADVGLVALAPLPLLETVMPGKLFDYLAAGLPVISLIKGQPCILLSSAKAGVSLKECTSDHLVKAVLEIADLPQEARRAMGGRGQHWVLKYMNAIDMAQEAVAVISKVSNEKIRLPRLFRLLGAGLAACGNVITRRSRRTIQKLFHEERQQTIQRSFDEWLNQSRGRRHTAPKMPDLLSNRNVNN